MRLGIAPRYKQNRKNTVLEGYANNAGSKNHTAKLTEVQVIEIITRLRTGESKAVLAKEFGVNISTIYRIITGETWRHLQPKRISEMRK